MTKADVLTMLKKIGIPIAYDHFAEGESPKPPFCVYLYPKADNFAADGVAFYKQDILHVEVYTNKKDVSLEDKIEAVFDEYGLFYAKSEVWIQSEKLYEVLYQMEV